MKTYFQFESLIKSKDVAEGIACPIGAGPFCGFGSVTVDGNTLKVQSQGNDDSFFKNDILDRINARYIKKNVNDGELPDIWFGCISRDGYIFISDEKEIGNIPIEGNRGVTDDVFLFAVHDEVTEPIENPVNFVAYWSEGSESLYTLYKKSLNPYYPIADNAHEWDINGRDPYINSQMNFTYLLKQVEANCTRYKNSKDSMVLIGIYGSGTDTNTNTVEDYSIVPYGGIFPQPLPFTSAYRGLVNKSVKRLENLLSGIPNDYENIKQYIDYLFESYKGSIDQSAKIIPQGAIMLWSGTTPPDGWALCDGIDGRPNLIGRFVKGWGPGNGIIGETGGNAEGKVTLNANQLPKHTHPYRDYFFLDHAPDGGGPGNVKYENIGQAVNPKNRSMDNPVWARYLESTSEVNNSAQNSINIEPGYYILAYIIKL